MASLFGIAVDTKERQKYRSIHGKIRPTFLHPGKLLGVVAHIMIIRRTFGLVALVALLVTGCATDKEALRKDALERDPAWPTIRAAAEIEIAHREGTTAWSYRAYYHPQQHTNGVWIVLAEGSYPMGTYGDYIDLVIRDGGVIVSAIPRKPTFHPQWN